MPDKKTNMIPDKTPDEPTNAKMDKKTDKKMDQKTDKEADKKTAKTPQRAALAQLSVARDLGDYRKLLSALARRHSAGAPPA